MTRIFFVFLKDLKMQQYYRKYIVSLPRYHLLTKLEEPLQFAPQLPAEEITNANEEIHSSSSLP